MNSIEDIKALLANSTEMYERAYAELNPSLMKVPFSELPTEEACLMRDMVLLEIANFQIVSQVALQIPPTEITEAYVNSTIKKISTLVEKLKLLTLTFEEYKELDFQEIAFLESTIARIENKVN